MRLGYHHPLRPPKGTNPKAVDLWMLAFDGSHDPVRRFEELCYEHHLDPYTHSKVGNADVQQFLRSRRQAVVRFLNLTRLLTQTAQIRRPVRKVTCYPGGFRLTITTQVQADPTFISWLRRVKLPYRFLRLRTSAGHYVCNLDPATTFFVVNPMINVARRWTVGYTIDCPMIPALKNAVPDDQYIIEQLWLPISRARRPINLHPNHI